MRILLTTLNSKYIHTNLSLKYLYSVVADSGLDVELREFTINNERDLVFGEIMRGGYDLVCFSCYVWNIEQIRSLCSDLKKARPDLRILLGGPEVSYESERFLRDNPWADFIIRGEGEKPFSQFCRELISGNRDFSKVSSLTYWGLDTVLSNEAGSLPYMDRLPFPYTYLEVETDKIVYYESVRGCPFRCSYCISSVDSTVRELSLERVRRDIGYLMYKNIRQVKFIDRTFNYNKARAGEIWQYIIDKDNGTTNFHFEICGDLLDSDSFRVLSRARKGLFQFEIGVQSANPYTLREISRKTETAEVLQNISKLMELGTIDVHVDLIAGLPCEDYRSFAESFDRVYAVHPSVLQLGFLKLLKGTRIRREAKEHGYVYRDKAPYEVISNKYMTAIDFVKLKMVTTVLDLYYNRGGFQRTLEFLIEDMEVTPFRFFERLADFYYSGKYHMASHKKEDLYRILYRFAMKQEAKLSGISTRAEHFLTLDMMDALNPEVVRRFMEKGWELK